MMNIIKKNFKILIIMMVIFVFLNLNYEKTFASDKQYVFDNAELLNEEERAELNDRCMKTSDLYKIDFAVCTTNDAAGMTSQKYAEDFILNNNLGYEEDERFDKSAILFLIDLDNNETYIATTGLGILCVEDNDIEIILDDIYIYIKTDYYKACMAFVESAGNTVDSNMQDYASQYVDEWETYDGTYIDFADKYVNKTENIFHTLRNPLICFVLAAAIGVISVALMTLNNRAKMTASGNTYMDKNEFKMHINSDKYINTTTTKIKINDDTDGSGGGGHGGSSHSGSGGHSFGGGGRSL